MKLKKLLEALPAIQAVNSTKIRATAALRLARNARLIDPELKDYDAARLTAAKEFGFETKDGYSFNDEGAIKFRDTIEKLLDEEIEITFAKITVEDLGDAVIEPGHLATLIDVGILGE